MVIDKIVLILCCALMLGLSGCSRQQSDWQKTRETNTAEAYEQFLKNYPSGEFTAQAQARVKELYEERDWHKARDADTAESYQAFLKEHPEGKWTEESRIRLENFTLAQTPSASGGTPGSSAAPSGTGTGTGPAGSGTEANPQASASTKPPTSAPAKAAGQSAAASKSTSGSYAVQLGAFKSGAAAANRRWARLQQQYPTLLAGLSPKVLPKKTATGTLYRLQAVGVSEGHARNICKSLRAKSQACMVVRPAHA